MLSRAGNPIRGFISIEGELHNIAAQAVRRLQSVSPHGVKHLVGTVYLDGELCAMLGDENETGGSMRRSFENGPRFTKDNFVGISKPGHDEWDGKNESGLAWIFEEREDFRSTMSAVLKSKDVEGFPREKDDPRMMLFLFDMINFFDETDPILSDRLKILESLMGASDFKKVRLLPQMATTEPLALEMPLEACRRLGWEGLILRRDCEYVGKRT
jgi:hypothetical protein